MAELNEVQHHNQQAYAAASGSSVPSELQSVGGGSALGLTLNQYNHPSSNSGTRPSTPNEYPIYSHPHITHSHSHHNHHQQPHSVPYAGFTPTSAISVLPNISGNGNSRPSTAGSLNIAHSLRRASAGNTVVSMPGTGPVSGSRPSTAGSLVYGHRPASAAGSIPMHASNTTAVGGADMSLGISPFQFDSTTNAMGGYGHGSRPSTANSVPPSAASSPYMRQGPLTGGTTSAGTQAGEAWAPSPLSQPQALVDSYFPSGLMHSPQPQTQNQDQSPLWSY